MNTDRPHEIVDIPAGKTRPAQSSPGDVRRWVPLTPEEARLLRAMTERQRAHWWHSLPFTERLRRVAKAEAERAAS